MQRLASLIMILQLLLCQTGSAINENSAEEQSSIESGAAERCARLFQATVVHYQALARLLPPGFKFSPQLASHTLLRMQATDCQRPQGPALIDKVLSQHTSKIALLLPLSQWPLAVRQAVVQQVNELAKSFGLDPQQALVWVDTFSSQARLESQLAQLVFVQHISILIGGVSQGEGQILARWADRLHIPAIILNRRLERLNSRYTFYIGPDQRLLASSLTRHALSRGMRRVAVLMPQTSRDGDLVEHFRTQAQHLHIEVVGPFVYNPLDFESIDQSVRKLLHIDDSARNPEMLDLVRSLKEKAEKEGVTFDSHNAVLPALVDVDAILIADHFKNVRHLAKTLAYYGVKKLPLLGIPKWRAFELVDHIEDILKGASFVDYVGSYRRLPYGITVATPDSEFFVAGADVGMIDLKLILSHSLNAARQALQGKRSPRHALYQGLEKSRGTASEFFSGPSIFRRDHIAYWPSFLFGVGEQSIQMLQVWNPAISDSRSDGAPSP